MMPTRRPKGGKEKEVPQWKLDMLRAETETAEPEGEPTAKRQREEISTASDHAAEHDGGKAHAAKDRDVAEDDDDDDDDVDLSAYDLGSNDASAELEFTGRLAPLPALTREELLLRREAAEGGGRRGKTFFIDDSKASQELSLGGERSKDRKRALEMASRLGIAAASPGNVPNTFGKPPRRFGS
jgi:hypothetical protein